MTINIGVMMLVMMPASSCLSSQKALEVHDDDVLLQCGDFLELHPLGACDIL